MPRNPHHAAGFVEAHAGGLGRLFERWLLPAFGSLFVKGLVKRYPTTFQDVKAKYIQGEGQFLREVGDGSFITDVTNENVVEFFIRCKK